MYLINRSVAVIRPKQPFVDWANNLPDARRTYSLERFQSECLVVLIPEYNTIVEARSYINEIWEDIFEEKLFGWCTEESWWPEDLSEDVFWEWFDVDFHSMVMDPYEDPIEKEID